MKVSFLVSFGEILTRVGVQPTLPSDGGSTSSYQSILSWNSNHFCICFLIISLHPLRCNDNIVAAPVSDTNSLAATRLTYYCRNRFLIFCLFGFFTGKQLLQNLFGYLTLKGKAHPRFHQCRLLTRAF